MASMRSSLLVCGRPRRAWVGWVVVLLLILSDLGPLSGRAQANELRLSNERGLADRIRKGRRRRRKRTRRKRLPRDANANENKTYLDMERGGRLEKYRLRNGIDDYEWSFAYNVEFIGDLRLFNDTERDILSFAFNESYAPRTSLILRMKKKAAIDDFGDGL
eukprot:scaffold38532_cov71-Attheya_sp.AAC.2